jgi:2-polyprenyl-3-methyl-5-hydroxy-6-metoxy-1,4-benzoquinol methylase
LRERYPDVEVVHSLFEEFETDKTFSCIVLGHVLEHVDSPVEILSHVKRFLAPGGSFLAAVPNANSLHRQAAVLMGLIPEIKHFSEKDIHHGHKRVYTAKELKADFVNAGLAVKVLGGYWLKPLSDGQIEASWTDGMVAAFMRLGEAYPEIAGEIYIVAGI